MVIALLLVIIAIMLFGSSAFIGAVGWVLGIIAGLIGLLMLADATGLGLGEIIGIGFLMFVGGIALLFVGASIWDKHNPPKPITFTDADLKKHEQNLKLRERLKK